MTDGISSLGNPTISTAASLPGMAIRSYFRKAWASSCKSFDKSHIQRRTVCVFTLSSHWEMQGCVQNWQELGTGTLSQAGSLDRTARGQFTFLRKASPSRIAVTLLPPPTNCYDCVRTVYQNCHVIDTGVQKMNRTSFLSQKGDCIQAHLVSFGWLENMILMFVKDSEEGLYSRDGCHGVLQ